MSKHTIAVELFIDSSPESVYELLAAHAQLDMFRELSHSRLLRAGQPDPNGLGAERQVVITMFGWLPVRFIEDITLAEPPGEFHYLVSKASILVGPLALWAGLKHYGGQVRIQPENGGCRVHWTSTIEVRIPLLGNLLGRKFKVEGERIFLSVLRQVGERLNKS